MLKRLGTSRIWVLTVGVMAILALTTLSAGLPNLRFRPPEAFFVEPGKPLLTAPGAPLADDGAWIRSLIIFLTMIGISALVAAAFDKRARKLLLKVVLYVALFLLASMIVREPPEELAVTATPPPVQGGTPLEVATPPPYQQPQISSLFSFLTALAIVAVAMGLGWLAWHRWRRPSATGGSLAGLRRIARATLDELASGGDWRDAVIRCYAQMCETVAQQRGLLRRPSMTAEEFAGILAEAGLPRPSVNRLTQLFEHARYAGRSSTRAEADEAASCLSEIVAAGGGPG
jgi:hypothetical protein